jgi:hypothetical protein|tara:strand:+ start:291 stop:467 length:177 start_codon:yes stop_codon:yes gene_type:complete
MEQKTPTRLNILYDKSTEPNRDRFSFAFSSNIKDWICSRRRKYDKKAYMIKAEKKSSI